MSYSEAAPGAALAAFVERVCFSSDERDAKPEPVRVVPDGNVDVLFSIGRSGACAAHVFGVKTRPLWAETEDPRENLLLRLRPGVVARLFGVAASGLTDQVIELSELAGGAARGFCDEIAEARGDGARLAAVERTFGAWAARAAREAGADDALLHRAVSDLRRSSGALPIAALTRSLGVGARRLERVFQARLGVTPKAYARLLRFFAAYRALAAGRAPLEAALAHGYFDQAHLYRDFARFAGAPPRRIFPSRAIGGPASLRA